MKKREMKPPRVAEWLLNHFTGGSNKFSIFGDFDEEFDEIAHMLGPKQARRWYWLHLVRSLPIIVKNSLRWNLTMAANYMRSAFRNLIKHKGFSLINIFGLSAGLACSTIIILYVFNELTFDRHHPDAHRVYRVATQKKVSREISIRPQHPAPWPRHSRRFIHRLRKRCVSSHLMRMPAMCWSYMGRRDFSRNEFFSPIPLSSWFSTFLFSTATRRVL